MTPAQLAYRAAHYVPLSERIGDEGVLGWVIAGAYLVAALACWRAARAMPGRDVFGRRVWTGLAAVLVCLGNNKQLDLHLVLLEYAREIALAQGWYRIRRLAQLLGFAIAVTTAMGGLAIVFPRVLRRADALSGATAGMILVAAYVIARMAKFQHILPDGPPQRAPPAWLTMLELAGIVLVAASAWRVLATRRVIKSRSDLP